jgi:hypothetical protein
LIYPPLQPDQDPSATILQLDENNSLANRIKLSRSLKALKSNPKKRHASKDLKQSIDKMLYMIPPLQSAVNLNSGDLRLFSIYGVPPKENAVIQGYNKRMGKKQQGSKKRREQSTNFPPG